MKQASLARLPKCTAGRAARGGGTSTSISPRASRPPRRPFLSLSPTTSGSARERRPHSTVTIIRSGGVGSTGLAAGSLATGSVTFPTPRCGFLTFTIRSLSKPRRSPGATSGWRLTATAYASNSPSAARKSLARFTGTTVTIPSVRRHRRSGRGVAWAVAEHCTTARKTSGTRMPVQTTPAWPIGKR